MIKRIINVLCAFLTCSLMLCSCGSSSSSGRKEAGHYDGGMEVNSVQILDEAPEMAMGKSMTTGKTASVSSGASNSSEASNNKTSSKIKLIRTVNIQIKTEENNVSVMTYALDKRASDYGGYASSKSVSEDNYSTEGYITVRIPADKADDFLNDIKEAGYNVTDISDNSEDVTLKYSDTAARISVLETEQKNYMGYLENATSIEETMTVERELRVVTEELESLRAQMRTLNNQIDYTTISIRIVYNSYAVPTSGDRWKKTFQEAGENIQEGMMGVVEMFSEGLIPILGYILIAAIGIKFALFILRLFSIISKKSSDKIGKIGFFRKKEITTPVQNDQKDDPPAPPTISK